MASSPRSCGWAGCGRTFEAQRSTAMYCSATCRQRAARDRKAAAESVTADADDGKPEHPLVISTRLELAAAGKVDTFNGQLALQLARRLVNPDESSVVTLSKELRAVMIAATASQPVPAAEAGAAETKPDDDEVTRARKAREQKARKAADRA